jgi:hypothetical protein
MKINTTQRAAQIWHLQIYMGYPFTLKCANPTHKLDGLSSICKSLGPDFISLTATMKIAPTMTAEPAHASSHMYHPPLLRIRTPVIRGAGKHKKLNMI